ncbi:MAG: alpha-E domain-containing protein [Cyanobacteria bacterium P01_D01_bin.105]
MLSRVADSIYWMNRYIERAENVARFVDVNLNLLMDNPVGMQQQWEPLIAVTGDRELFQTLYPKPTANNVLNFLTFDRRSPNSIRSCVRVARENARSVRETISSEMWQQINSFYLMVEDAAKARPDDVQQLDLPTIYKFYKDVVVASHRFVGVMNATASWNESWHFGRLGRLLERADKTSRILDVKYFLLLPSVTEIGSPLDSLQWIALLKSASAYEMYRKVEHTISPSGVARFLILDSQFPRSIKFCLRRAEESLHKISGTSIDVCNPVISSERALGRLRAEIEYVTFEEIFQQGLHEFLDGFQQRLNTVGNCIYNDFIAIPGETQQSDTANQSDTFSASGAHDSSPTPVASTQA